jgi:hypothetical protein
MGIPSLLKNFLRFPSQMMRRSRGPNRRLTPEEVAQRNLESAKQATQVAKGRYEKASTHLDEVLQPYRMKGSTAMRAKQVGDETMKMIKDSIMKMDLPAAKKVEAIKSAATAVRNASPAQLAKANPAQLSMDIIKMVGAAGAGLVGGIALEGAAREGRLPEMIQDSFLVRPEFRGMRDNTGQAVGKMMGATMMGAGAGAGAEGATEVQQSLLEGAAAGAAAGAGAEYEDMEYTLPFEEPLGEGMIPDLFLDPLLDKLLGD